LAGFAFIAAAVFPGSASAETLRADTAVKRTCAARALSPAAPGAATASWTAPAEGLLTARLDAGPQPDWDLALLRNGAPAGASTSFGSRELATIAVRAGDQVVAQACRRAGPPEAELELDLFETAGVDPPSGRASLESVAISGPGDVIRLEQLGLDVTHDVSDGAATVALYNDGQRALLSNAGFSSTTLIHDMAAKDLTQRRAEDRAAATARVSPLPTGRESYRVYEDFTTELKNLAEDNPALVRPVTLGNSFEGRPIEGVEISSNVNAADDGKPVYLNFGAHHAREWPSAEFPMEFAHTLVNGFNSSEARIVNLLDDVRVVIVPVVNPDGFVASRSFGTSPLDDNADANIAQIVGNQGAYIRKNCRPTDPAQANLPCALRSGSGVDLNRNYGYYWGGPGSSTDTTSQGYRGAGPFSEPESEAVHQFSSQIHPTVFITNHTFTDTGWWLRQPGFDGAFLPQGADGAITPDEPAMKALGDAMGDTGVDDPALGATGWPSDLGWELGDITGATEDWNYFAQGTYGYTPEARGPNFHGTYANMVVTEYIGDASHPGEGVREAFLLAGEEAAETDNHGVIQGTVPPGATLTLSKSFEAPTFNQPDLNVDETLETTLRGAADGTYEWHVMPSDRPQISGGPPPDPGDEEWTMTCQRAGGGPNPPIAVEVARNQTVNVDWDAACGTDPPGNDQPVADFDVSPITPAVGQQVNLTSTSTDPDGAIQSTEWDLDDDGDYDDASGLVATTSFPSEGTFEVGIEVTDNEGATDDERKTVTVSNLNAIPTASFTYSPQNPAVNQNVVFDSNSSDPDGAIEGLAWDFDDDGQFDDASGGKVTRSFPADGVYPVRLRATDDDGTNSFTSQNVVVGQPVEMRCGGLVVTRTGTLGPDRISGSAKRDVIAGFAGRDRIAGGGGNDVICGGGGRDRLRGGPGNDELLGQKGRDALLGGGGIDACKGGPGRDRLRSCP
jgi:hypothetical protein